MALGIVEPRAAGEQTPGTELLVDDGRMEGEHGREHEHFMHGKGKKTNIILVPQPSDDPNDPLLWPTWKREAAFAFIFFNCIVFAACPGPMIAPATVALAAQLHVPVKHVAELSGYQLLIVGALGPVVSVLAQKFGKRPQFLVASFFGVVGTGICIAGFDQEALGRSYDVLLAGRMVQGIGTTAYESLSVAAIGDMFFLHERGLRTALLVLTLACLSSFVAIIGGTLFENLGARNLFVVLLPIQIFGFLGTFFLLPESQFRRDVATTTSTAPVGVVKEKDGGNVVSYGMHESTVTGGTSSSSIAPTKRSFVQDLRFTSGTYTQDSMLKLLGEIFVHLLNPAVIWIQLVSAILVSFFVGTAYTLAQIFTPPPYSLSVSQNGYFFTGALLGGILGVSAGPLCDFTAKTLAKRNKGVYEAEFRIPVCIFAVVLFAVGWFTFGWALDHPTYSHVYLCSFCYGAVCFGTSVASTSAGLYILDAFRAHSTQIFILQMMIKNFLFYAFSTFVNELVATHGAGYMCRVFGTVTLCGFITCVPMYVFGKVNRVWAHAMWRKYIGERK